MLTYVHEVILLVVDTFEQGLGTSPAECPHSTGGQSDGATGALYRKTEVTVSDRTLASVGPTRPVSRSCNDAGVGL